MVVTSAQTEIELRLPVIAGATVATGVGDGVGTGEAVGVAAGVGVSVGLDAGVAVGSALPLALAVGLGVCPTGDGVELGEEMDGAGAGTGARAPLQAERTAAQTQIAPFAKRFNNTR